MDHEGRSDEVEPEEEHVQATDAKELTVEEQVADVQEQAPEGAQARDDLPGLGPNTSADVGGAGGGTTSDPGRQNPITPGEGRL